MRISTIQLFQQRIDALQAQQQQLSRTEMQLATGKRLVTPADDPAASLRNLQLEDRRTMNVQFMENLDRAQGRLELEEGALASGVDLLQRVRELAVGALNGTNSAGDLQSIGAEVRSLLDGLVGIANTRNANGEYLFGGYQAASVPFADNGSGNVSYSGDRGNLHLQVSPTRQLAVADNGADTFMVVPASSGGTVSVFDVVNDFATALASGSPQSATLTDLDTAMDVLLGVRADVGSRLRAVDEQRNVNDSFNLVIEREQSDIMDLDYAEAISRFNRELLAFQASEQVIAKVQGLSLFNYLN
ncbi:MAG: flagellar hook-associated protein FlgL [Gammaproteobacteria bacterium]|nr:flagellar hook-associated protein FlgL [Gammaproteobacteria bacterium]